MIHQCWRTHGRASIFLRCLTSSTDKCEAALVIRCPLCDLHSLPHTVFLYFTTSRRNWYQVRFQVQGLCFTTAAHVWSQRRRGSWEERKNLERVDVSLESGSHLLKPGNGQSVSHRQPVLEVAIVAATMGHPASCRFAMVSLAVSCKAARLSRHPRKEESVANHPNHSGESGGRASSPSCGQMTT